MRLINTVITTNAATILLDGANSNFYSDTSTTSALANLAANAAGGSLTIQNGRNLSVPGAFSNAGSITVGSGSTLTAAGNYSQSAGTTTLNGGTLTASTTVSIAGGTLTGTGTINANVSNAGQVNPGLNLGTLSINGTYAQTSTGTLNVELGGLSAGSQYDQVAVSGTATLGGTLNVSLVNGLVVVPGNSFRILTFSSSSGDFGTKNGLNVGNGLHLVPVYDAGDLTLLTKGDTTTSLTSSANPSPFGQMVTFTATVNSVPSGGASPTGTVTFTVDGVAQPAVTLSGNQASFSTSPLGVGTHTITAAYSGESNYFASTSTTLTETITKVATTTTVSASVTPSVYGQSVIFTATVAGTVGSGTPSGAVTFCVDGVAQAPVTLAGGQAALSLATLGAGSHNITAAYSGDSNYGNSSSSTFTEAVSPAPLTVTANAQTKVYGSADPVLTYVASGFQFSDTAASVLTGALSRAAGETVAGGPYAISQGTLGANSNYSINFSGNVLTITPAALTITANNQTKTYGATLPALTVTYSGFVNGDTAASLTTPPTVSTTATAASHVAGSPYPISLSGAVDSNYSITYVNGSLTVTPAPLTITANNQTKVYGASLPTFTASYSGFVLGDTSSVLSGTLNFSTTATASSPVGTYVVTPGGQTSTDYAITYANGTLTISPANTTTALSSSANPSQAGQAVTFTATVAAVAPGAGTPTGTVTFTIDGTAQPAVTLSGGQATLTTSSLGTGSHTVTAFYGGDGNFNTSSSGTLTQTVNGSMLSISVLSPPSVVEGSPVFTLTVTGTGFAAGFTVQWNGSPLATTFVDATRLRASVPAAKVADEGTARITVVNPGGTTSNALTFTITDAVPVVGAITAPTAPVAVNTSVTARASFTDAGTLDTHTAVWNWGDGTTSVGTVTEHNGSGSVSGRHTYTIAGLYTVTLTVSDNTGSAGQATFSYVVVFDKAAGILAGAGSITSRAGDYTADPRLTGTLDFALGAGYLDGINTPVGLTELWLSAANLHFQSTGYDWLVINGGHALYQGSGTINGTGSFGFVVAALDGHWNGGSGPDAIRIRLWDKDHSNAVVYDTQPGAPIPATPTTTLDSGAIMILPLGGPGAPTAGGKNFPRAQAIALAQAPVASSVASAGDPLALSWFGTSPAFAGLETTPGNAGAPQDILFANSPDGLLNEVLPDEETLWQLLQSPGLSDGVEK